jgi:hypothetical protein
MTGINAMQRDRNENADECLCAASTHAQCATDLVHARGDEQEQRKHRKALFASAQQVRKAERAYEEKQHWRGRLNGGKQRNFDFVLNSCLALCDKPGTWWCWY